MMLRWVRNTVIFGCYSLFLTACFSENPAERLPIATLVITNATIYTANEKQEFAQAAAILNDRIIFVGSDDDVVGYIGNTTQVIDAEQQLVLPGLHDIHLHPFGLIASTNCDLESQPLDLPELKVFIEACIANSELEDGQWLTVEQWNFTKGNKPSANYPNIRTALDAASNTHPIFLRGNDGHHGAVNSVALSTATNVENTEIGLNSATIVSDFSEYEEYIGLDAQGEPDGNLSESARYLLGLPGNALTGDGSLAELSAKMPAINTLLSKAGITSIQDAAADISTVEIYERFSQSGNQHYRLTAALYSDFTGFSRPLTKNSQWTKQNSITEVDIPQLMSKFKEIRDRQKNVNLFKADAAKIFIDGVIEGNPLATPPALPNAAVYKPYLQPIFSHNDDGLQLIGYVDTESEICNWARKHNTITAAKKIDFEQKNGFSPEQCMQNNGRLEHDEEFINTYITSLERAGFSVHAHTIGDRAFGVALNAFIRSKAETEHQRPQTISHAQQISDRDLDKISLNPVFLAFTFAWAVPDYEYDITVTPFIDRLESLKDVYDEKNYSMTNHYPTLSAKLKGAIIAAGSDAPVDTRDPRPFVNLAAAVTRSAEGRIYNENERLSILDALDAFTINGAKALQQSGLTGSIETGKKADLIIVDTDLIKLAKDHDTKAIANTRVNTTVFDGKIVYQRQLTN